ncbi:MAG: cobalamin B12-binding domain-containing protein [Roseicyclus sp.]
MRDLENEGPKPASNSVPPDMVAALASHVLRRMVRRVASPGVSDAFLDGFCTLLSSNDGAAADRLLRSMLAGRAGYARLADGILSAAARRLGEKWQADLISFGDVSIAVGQILRLSQAHAERHVPLAIDRAQRQALFVTLPGQAHNLGLVLAAEAFRQADWQVTVMLDTPAQEVLERARRVRPGVVGLSLSRLDRQHQIRALIAELGDLPFRVRVVLGGGAAAKFAGTLPQAWDVVVAHDICSALEMA